MYKEFEYFSPQLMGTYDGRVIGTSNLVVENIILPPNPSIICNIKQPSNVVGNNPSLFFDLKQSEGITIACDIIKNSKQNIDSTPLYYQPSRKRNHCKFCCY